jgi:hypothetical protein
MATQRRREWLERIRAVEREFLVARKAVDDFLSAIRSGGTNRLPANTKLRDVEAMSDNLEGTYLIRLFAAFESGLRSYWRAVRKRKTKPGTEQLIDSVASSRNIPDDVTDTVHQVRRYRNSLVHEENAEAAPITLSVARGSLCTYFARQRREPGVFALGSCTRR